MEYQLVFWGFLRRISPFFSPGVFYGKFLRGFVPALFSPGGSPAILLKSIISSDTSSAEPSIKIRVEILSILEYNIVANTTYRGVAIQLTYYTGI